VSKPPESDGKVWVPRCAITYDPGALDELLKTTVPGRLTAGTGGPMKAKEKERPRADRKGRRGG